MVPGESIVRRCPSCEFSPEAEANMTDLFRLLDPTDPEQRIM